MASLAEQAGGDLRYGKFSKCNRGLSQSSNNCGMTMRFFVLLRNGTFEMVSCVPEAVFELARLRKGGICGVFDDPTEAEAYIARISSGLSLNDTVSGPGAGLPTI